MSTNSRRPLQEDAAATVLADADLRVDDFNPERLRRAPEPRPRRGVACLALDAAAVMGAGYRTQFNGYAVAFSPFVEGRLAVATAQNFGIIGNGKQYVLEAAPGGGPLREVAVFDTADGLYDCCWAEDNEHVLVSASGDGSVKVWDLSAPPQANPLRSFEEHTHEVYAVSWNLVRRDCFLSASWDDTAKLWTLGAPGSVRTFAEHTYCVYAAAWNPANAEIFATASGDCTLKVWDTRQPHSTLTIPAHDFEILSADWNKYNDCVIASASVDKSVKLWDIRAPGREMAVLAGHTYAVRRVKCNPHSATEVYSCSYDMTMCLWDYAAGPEAGGPLRRRWDHHTEFAVGLDCSVLTEGVVTSCGWDEMVYVWHRDEPDPRMGLQG